MTEQYVVAGLVRKRAELSGEIEHTQARLRQLVKDLESVDAALGIFAPDMVIEGIRPKAFRPPADWSSRGQMTRMVLGILRLAAEPLTARDIAERLISERALDADDQRLLKLMTKRVGVALRVQRDKGIAQSYEGQAGQYLTWELTRE